MTKGDDGWRRRVKMTKVDDVRDDTRRRQVMMKHDSRTINLFKRAMVTHESLFFGYT